MSGPIALAALTLAAVAVGIALGVPLARWQLRNAGRPSQAAWAVVFAFGGLALVRLAGGLAVPVAALFLTAAASSVVVIRRELRRRGRI